MPIPLPRPTLMLVTEPMPNLSEVVRRAVEGGANAIQVREKEASIPDLSETVRKLQRTIERRALLFVNGSAELAHTVEADGLHLPENGLPIRIARQIVGKGRLVGRSVHSVESALTAEADGADYLIAGTIFPSASHTDVEPAGIEFLRAVCAAVQIPVIAIGGITSENVGDCLQAGAVGVAVLSRILQAADPCVAAESYWNCMASHRGGKR